MSYGDVHIAHFYSEGWSAAEIFKTINHDDFFHPLFVNSMAFNSIMELRHREVEMDADVIATDMILAEWRTHRLFHVPNHPTRRLMASFINRLFKIVGLPITVALDGEDYFTHPRQIIYPSAAKGLRLTFDSHSETTELLTSNGRLSFEDYVHQLVATYDRGGGRDLVARNLYKNPMVRPYLAQFKSIR